MHENETSLFKELKEQGYYVWMNSRNDLVAGQISGLAESHANEIHYYDKNKPLQRLSPSVLKNFGHKASDYPYSHYMGIAEREMGADSMDVKAAINRIENPVSDQPLCLFLGLVNPHPPYVVEKKYYDQIQKNKLPERVKAKDTEGKSLMLEELRKFSGLETYTEEQWEEIQTVYLAQCAMVDDLFGQLCDALKRMDMYDNSAIFILSDHGDFAGDYDLPEKAQNTFEDCLTKVPLLVKPPKGEGLDPGVSDSIVELIDFYATAMDYAQCDAFRFLESDPGSKGGDYWARDMAQDNPIAHEKGTMIFDGRYKYVERLSGRNELYDLQMDPKEKKNIYNSMKETPIVTELRIEMLKWYQNSCDTVPRNRDNRFTEERVWASVRKFCPPAREQEVREYIRTGVDIPTALKFCATFENEH